MAYPKSGANSKSVATRPRTKRKGRSVFSRFAWLIWTLVTSGSVAGWMISDIPVVGPVVEDFVASGSVKDVESLTSVVSQSPALASLTSELLHRLADSAAPSKAAPAAAAPSGARLQKPADTIRIGSYNIQVFGTSKLAKPAVVDVLVQLVRHCDVVAIQEVRAKDDTVVPTFVAAVNADGSRYDFVIGPRLGRTVSTEQYVFVYDTDRIELDRSSVGTMVDTNDLLHREPLVARFRARGGNVGLPFSFWLINIHTDPDEVASEIDVLADVFQVMQTARPDEDDVILLGDLNASDQQLGRLGQVPGIACVVTGITTNTRRTKMYDNLLFNRFTTTEFTGRWGVVDVQSVFNLTLEQALEVSDHLPIWAEFRACESPPASSTARWPDRPWQ
jgi:endonuclease/exonuclease/phosphatase family metal-dependent hydrolase